MITAPVSTFALLVIDGTNVLRALELVPASTVIDADTRGYIRIVHNVTGHGIDVEWAISQASRTQQRDLLSVQVTDIGRNYFGSAS